MGGATSDKDHPKEGGTSMTTGRRMDTARGIFWDARPGASGSWLLALEVPALPKDAYATDHGVVTLGWCRVCGNDSAVTQLDPVRRHWVAVCPLCGHNGEHRAACAVGQQALAGPFGLLEGMGRPPTCLGV